MRFGSGGDGFDPDDGRPTGAAAGRGWDDAALRRPPSVAQADGDPGRGSAMGRARPAGSYGELNYRDEDSPRGHSRVAGRFRGRGPKGFQRSDERLREDVSEALAVHGDVDASQIEVRVGAGEVTLDGIVPDRRTKWLAEDCVLAVPGVRDVHNNLRVVRPPGQLARTEIP